MRSVPLNDSCQQQPQGWLQLEDLSPEPCNWWASRDPCGPHSPGPGPVDSWWCHFSRDRVLLRALLSGGDPRTEPQVPYLAVMRKQNRFKPERTCQHPLAPWGPPGQGVHAPGFWPSRLEGRLCLPSLSPELAQSQRAFLLLLHRPVFAPAAGLRELKSWDKAATLSLLLAW